MKKVRSRYSHPDFQFVRFRLGLMEFGIDVASVREIIRFSEAERQDGAPDFIEGFLNLRSISVPVIDLRKRFRFPDPLTDGCRVLLTAIDGRIAGLVVDEVTDITMGASEFTLRPECLGDAWDGCIEAAIDTPEGKVLIINTSEMLTAHEKGLLKAPFAVPI